MVQIRRVTQWIREHYAGPFRVEPLAQMSDMSVAAFYRHFKSVTAMTPIQYQKRLRLLRARWLLLFDTLDATSIAYAVGYESASQFNREYARLLSASGTGRGKIHDARPNPSMYNSLLNSQHSPQKSVITVPAILWANPPPNTLAGVAKPACCSPFITRRAASTAASGV